MEQYKQASRIHGGIVSMWIVALGVRLSRVPIPSRRLRERVYRKVYGSKYRELNEKELERPLTEYRSINELFTRGVPEQFRPIDKTGARFVCPCDGRVQDIGEVRDQTLLTIKKSDYTLRSLVPEMEIESFRNGRFGIFFLSPADCHRVFAPQEGTLEEIMHVPGRRLLVHPEHQKDDFPVFTLNERVVMRFNSPLGQYLVIMVAGWGVGHITHPFPSPVKANGRSISRANLETPRQVERGEWIATFELGSTVILITEPSKKLEANVSRDQPVQYGQSVFSVREDQP